MAARHYINMTKEIEIAGKTFGEWTPIVKAAKNPPRWLCRCSCGTEKIIYAANLRRGASTHCGCKRVKKIIHGHSRRSGKTRTYRQWKAMRSRCRPDAHDAHNYYQRGISVCSRWDDYLLFLEDMGECPDGLTLDRINNDEGYRPDNCRWADMKTQRRNQRRVTMVVLDGQEMCVQDATDILGVHAASVWNDVKRNGVTPQQSVDRLAAKRRAG